MHTYGYCVDGRTIGSSNIRSEKHVLNYYDLLGVEPTADLETIRHAWRVRIRLLHPDIHQGAPEEVQTEAVKETLRVNRAWGTLRDPEKRRDYDLQLVVNRAGRPRPAPPRDEDERSANVSVTCAACATTQRVPRAEGRFECVKCKTAWQFAKCERCYRIANIREHRANWRCASCGRQQPSSWGGAQYVVCVRCASRTSAAAGDATFDCAQCGLEHIRCKCGKYTTFVSVRPDTWLCPHCKRLNPFSPHLSFDVATFSVAMVAVCLLVAGLILITGMLQ